MRLTEIPRIVPVEVVRDGRFGTLGLLSHRGDGVLAGYYDARFANVLTQNSDLTCVITTRKLAPDVPEHIALATADDAKIALYGLHEYLHRKTDFYWKDFQTEIAPDARIHESAYVAPRNVRIGSGTVVEPLAIVLERSIVGSHVTIRSGAMIGGEGFEPKWVGDRHLNIPHAGGVKIGNRVEILCGAHIARSVFGGFTEIGDGTVVDALVHIAHNAIIGRDCEIAANAVVAGSVKVGDQVWIGPNACISSEVEIGNRAFITLGSVVIHSVPERGRVTGYFAFEHDKFKRAFHRFAKGQ
jgi:UDP-3-O-[3-hydroxymyristoyl] glucosamine N-acyltransferase